MSIYPFIVQMKYIKTAKIIEHIKQIDIMLNSFTISL